MIDARRLTTLSAFAHIFFSFFFFFLRSAAQTSLRPSWGRFAGNASGFLCTTRPINLSYSQEKRGQILLMIVPLSSMRCGTGPRIPTHSAASHCSQPSIWHNRCKISYQQYGNKGSLFASPAQQNLGAISSLHAINADEDFGSRSKTLGFEGIYLHVTFFYFPEHNIKLIYFQFCRICFILLQIT